jgi:protein-disulfide isomerase
MEKTNLVAIAFALAFAGFLVGRFDAKPATAAPAAAVPVAPAPEGSPAPVAAPATSAPSEPAAAAPSPSPAQEAPKTPSLLDSQSDEGAGKGVDTAKIGTSPKSGSAYLGPKDALVVVNVYSDFQCPVCRRSADPIKQLAADFPGKVKVFFRNNALEMHGRAMPAALAAAAAGRQGKFWPYHDKLFKDQTLDDQSLRQYAQEVGLNLEQWERDRNDPALLTRMKEEASWAEKMGATGTPGFFVNGVRQVGWGSYLALKSIVQRELDKADELIAGGTAKNQVLAKRIAEFAPQNSKNEGEGAIDGGAWSKMLTAD